TLASKSQCETDLLRALRHGSFPMELNARGRYSRMRPQLLLPSLANHTRRYRYFRVSTGQPNRLHAHIYDAAHTLSAYRASAKTRVPGLAMFSVVFVKVQNMGALAGYVRQKTDTTFPSHSAWRVDAAR